MGRAAASVETLKITLSHRARDNKLHSWRLDIAWENGIASVPFSVK
jgi:hypothetical protein